MICKICIISDKRRAYYIGQTPRILHRANAAHITSGKRRAYYIGRNVAVERRASSSSLVK